MKKSDTDPQPDYKDYLGSPGLYVEAMRVYHGLSYGQLAQQVRSKTRGSNRKGSANYFYRLGKGQTTLRSELVPALGKVFGLGSAETEFLRQSSKSGKSIPASRRRSLPQSDDRQSGSALLRLLDASPAAREQEVWLKTLVNPLVFAVYALAGSALGVRDFARQVARSASKKTLSIAEVRDAVALLGKAGLLAESGSDKPEQVAAGKDLMVSAAQNIADNTRREAMKHFYRQLDRWGGETLDTVEREKRYFASLTFLVEEKDLAALARDTEKEWCALRDRLRTKYESRNGESAVHLGIREWPMVRLAKRLQGGTT